jgi:hypothetical protein
MGGAITSVALAVNSARRASLRNAGLVSNIVTALPAQVQVRIIANDPDAFIVSNNPWPDRIQFLELPVALPITIWTQDPFLVLRSAGGDTTLLMSRSFERAADEGFALRLAQDAGFRTRRSRLHFEGGNIVSDEAHVFVGANTIHHNARTLQLSETDIAAGFEQELGRKLLVVGPAPQPIAHIDMMLTPLGAGRVALADPAAGAAVVERLLREQPQAVAEFERSIMAGFFGHPAIRALDNPDGSEITAPQLQGQTAEMVAASQQLAPVLDGIAAALAQHGYRVERVPFLFGGPDADPADSGPQAGYPMLTYNNVLLETTPAGAQVYLPNYGLAALDEAAASAWQALGFTVHPVDGLVTSAMYGGALRCSVKVLGREPLPR